jgi:drug/metabolite transporter (DMT)-like permease
VIRERSAPPPGGATTGTNDERARDGHGLDLLGIFLGPGAAACQAGANVLVKLGGESHDALPIAVVRLAAGAAGLVLVVAVRQRLHESARVFSTARVASLLLLATLIGTYLGIWLQVAGLTGAKAGVAATLSSTAPIFVLPLAVVFLGERPSARAVAGALVAVLGIAILFLF